MNSNQYYRPVGLMASLFTMMLATSVEATEPSGSALSQIIGANNNVAGRLYSALGEKSDRGFVVAPYGVLNVMLALQPGAGGSTAAEISSFLTLAPETPSRTLLNGALILRDSFGASQAPSLGIEGTVGPDGRLLITKVTEHSLAALAGVKAGDVIVTANGKAVHSVSALAVELTAAGAIQFGVQTKDGMTFKVVLSHSQGSTNAQIRSSTALWGQTGLKYKPYYVGFARRIAQGGIQPVDFTAVDETRNSINQWAAAQTDGEIKDLLGPGDITRETRLVAVNTLFFEAKWESPFDPAATKSKPFVTVPAATKPIEVPLMSQQGDYPYFRGDDFQSVELPYQGGRFSLILVVPDKPASLVGLLGKVAKQSGGNFGKYTETTVQVALPKFNIHTRTDLKPLLIGMGMSSAFDPQKADFSGIIDDPKGLSLSTFVQSAFIDVDESGTRAGAATAAGLAPRSKAKETVIADRPFVFIVLDRGLEAVLFAGEYTGPQQSTVAAPAQLPAPKADTPDTTKKK